MQDSAYPFHDWNERITFECYAPNTASRILGNEGDIVDIVNNYSRISFNFGPTLLSWLEVHEPDVYKAILRADQESLEYFSGHGSAMAQVYGHIILPLASPQDKVTQVMWGIKDFEYRFGRKPEGMWLSEAAVDTDSLEILATHGIKFTVLAPRQAKAVRKLGTSDWHDVHGDWIDPRIPYVYKLPSGKSIVLFFYDGHVSQDVAFKGLLKNGRDYAERLLATFSHDNTPQLAHIATDGESYGHHHRHGDMALSYGLHYIETHEQAKITNYSQFLSLFPPTQEVQIFENSSWSCVHGVERWRNNCGCNSGGKPGWHQAWRAPLRQALDWLRDNLVIVYEKSLAKYIKEPWKARNEYIQVILDRSEESMQEFVHRHAGRELPKPDQIKVIKLLEMQRHAMLMYTSCGWFFDEVSGIETIQVMQYASRAIQLAEEVDGVKVNDNMLVNGIRLEEMFVQKLEQVPSNEPEYCNAAVIYREKVKPARLDLTKVGAHYAISSLFEAYPENLPMYSYLFRNEVYDRMDAGIQQLVVGMAKVSSVLTMEESEISFAVLYLGQLTIITNAYENMPVDTFAQMHQQIRTAFLQSRIADVIRLMDDYFVSHRYSLFYLSKDQQRKITSQIMQTTLGEIETSFRQVYEHNYHMMNLMNHTDSPLPDVFKTTVEFVLNSDLRQIFEAELPDLDQLERVKDEVQRWRVKLDSDLVGYVVTKKMNSLMKQLESSPSVERVKYINELFKIVKTLPLNIDIWMIQNTYFFIGTRYSGEIRDLAAEGDVRAQKWSKYFSELGDKLDVKIV
jgi:alpha-amylase/alpha-mannosidase (GH57 family)